MSTVQPGTNRTGGGITPFTTAVGTGAGAFWGGPVGAGLGAAAGQVAGQALSSDAVNFRGKYQRNVAAHNRAQISPDMAARMKALDESGLHRLSALGIVPSGAPAQQPMIPGQSDYGNVVSDGINTALNVARSEKQSEAQTVYQGLKLEEQKLRNDWLRTQIANSKLKTLTAAANASQGMNLADVAGKPHSGNIVVSEQPPIPHTGQSAGYSLFGGDTIKQKPGVIRGQALEDSVGEVPAALISPFQFMQDIGYTLDQMLYQRHKTRKSNPYKGMGKTGYTK